MLEGLSNVALPEEAVNMDRVNAKRSIAYIVVKRLFDILCSLIGLMFMLPIAVIVKIMYVCTGDFKSIFYTHTRVGKDGKEFGMYKFRTMVPNAKEMLETLLKDPK